MAMSGIYSSFLPSDKADRTASSDFVGACFSVCASVSTDLIENRWNRSSSKRRRNATSRKLKWRLNCHLALVLSSRPICLFFWLTILTFDRSEVWSCSRTSDRVMELLHRTFRVWVKDRCIVAKEFRIRDAFLCFGKRMSMQHFSLDSFGERVLSSRYPLEDTKDHRDLKLLTKVLPVLQFSGLLLLQLEDVSSLAPTMNFRAHLRRFQGWESHSE
jgi:hypothetical protein